MTLAEIRLTEAYARVDKSVFRPSLERENPIVLQSHHVLERADAQFPLQWASAARTREFADLAPAFFQRVLPSKSEARYALGVVPAQRLNAR
jgi:hypothetical protein